jgi:hypothetical protein
VLKIGAHRGVQAQIIWGANLIPVGGRVRRVTISRREPPCSRMPANGVVVEGSDGGALATPGRGRWEFAASMCGRRPIREFQTKSPRRISPRGLCSFLRW